MSRSCWLHIVLAAFSGSCETMSAHTFLDCVGNQIQAVHPPSQTLRLFRKPSDNDPANVAVASWSTTDRRVLPVEIRISLAGWPTELPAALSAFRDPILGYTIEPSVGGSTIVKHPSFSRGSAYAVPARGAIARVLARDVRVSVRFDEHFDYAAITTEPRFDWVDVHVSFTPCDDLRIATPPTAAYSKYYNALQFQPFPPEAREFRLVTLAGKPFAEGFSRDVAFITAIGGYLRDTSNSDMTFDRFAFGEWTPISPRWAGWAIVGGMGNWDEPPFGAPIPDVPVNDSEFVTALYR